MIFKIKEYFFLEKETSYRRDTDIYRAFHGFGQVILIHCGLVLN